MQTQWTKKNTDSCTVTARLLSVFAVTTKVAQSATFQKLIIIRDSVVSKRCVLGLVEDLEGRFYRNAAHVYSVMRKCDFPKRVLYVKLFYYIHIYTLLKYLKEHCAISKYSNIIKYPNIDPL